jgi:hypothetical protein
MIFIIAVLLLTIRADTCFPVSNRTCPEYAPCCGYDGYCGSTGTFCAGGCKPSFSYSALRSCWSQHTCYAPTAVTLTPQSTMVVDGVQRDQWDGVGMDQWVVEQGMMNDGSLQLSRDGGTRISLPFYVDHVRVRATVHPAIGTGVISSLILMSDTRDEVDWEWLGRDPHQVESNWYYQGELDYTQGRQHPCLNGCGGVEVMMERRRDAIEWWVDGVSVRTLQRNGTRFPADLARVILSIWSSSAPYQPEGVREWGGVTDWNQTMYTFGIERLMIECLSPQPATATLITVSSQILVVCILITMMMM